MTIPFVKMSGAGNDFIVVDQTAAGSPGLPLDPMSYVPTICDRRRGVGADGVIILGPPGRGDFTMTYYNADGTSGSLCGNGGRCAASLMMDRLGVPAVRFDTCGRTYQAERTPAGVKLWMDDPGPLRSPLQLTANEDLFTAHYIDTGSPHLVLPLKGELPDADFIRKTGRLLRFHPEFQPGGTNVNFTVIEDVDHIRIRTFERGVEDETWACGTGAVASAMVHSVLNGGEGERTVKVVPLSGDLLTVRFFREGASFRRVSLEGNAVITFTGAFEIGSS